MPWMSRWPRKIPRQTSTANTEDAGIDSLLAQAEYIMNNPDEFVGENESAEVELAVCDKACV